ncbi:hypothetical protein [Fusibacter bizertensis]
MLYHVSRKNNLKILEPNVSTHGKAYVYAIENIVTAMLFGAPQDDFDFIIDVNNYGVPRITECYKDGFRSVYKGQSCSIYTLNRQGFKNGITGWSPEFVSENRVRVLKEEHVEDLFNRLIIEEQQENLIVRRYENNEEYELEIENHITDRLIRFNMVNCRNIDERILSRYGNIIDKLRG